jgi:aminoglycoside phosphotransferase family enzyme
VYELDKIHKIYKRLISFVANNKTLFYKRIRQGKIREIHGDLDLGNIFVVNDKRFYLYDRLEFNDSLRYADVTEDVAHLSMDLDYNRRIDLFEILSPVQEVRISKLSPPHRGYGINLIKEYKSRGSLILTI